MIALGFNGPWDLALVEHAEPIVDDGDVLVAVIATGICGSDVHGYTGATGRRHGGQVMGHEAVGRVLDTGSSVSGLEVGTLVTINPLIPCGSCVACGEGESQVCPQQVVIGVEPTFPGSFAERVVAPAANIVPISERIRISHGALVEPLAVGYHAAQRGQVRPEDRVLVIGGGPIGQAVAIAARRMGAESVLVSEPSIPKRDVLEHLGFAATDPDMLTEAVARVLCGTATVVIDAVGIDASMAAALEQSTTRSRIVLVGMGAKDLHLTPFDISVGERHVLGSYCYSNEHFASTAEWVSEGHPELDLLIDRELPLSAGPETFRALADGSIVANKILLISTPA